MATTVVVCCGRSYGRVGLGYLTGIVGLIGFYFGYLPYVYFHEAIDGFIANHTFVRATSIPEVPTSDPMGQKVVGVLYTISLVVLFVVVVIHGAKRIGATPREYLAKNTDDLALRNIDGGNNTPSRGADECEEETAELDATGNQKEKEEYSLV